MNDAPATWRSRIGARLPVSLLVVMMAACGGGESAKPATEPDPAVCLYGFEWLHAFRFPLQPDPHAAYSYIVPKLPAETPVGFLIDAEFPYAAWCSWTIYGEGGLAFSLASDHGIMPDAGSTNPFVVGNPCSRSSGGSMRRRSTPPWSRSLGLARGGCGRHVRSSAGQLFRLPRGARRPEAHRAHPASARRLDLRHGGHWPRYHVPGSAGRLHLADDVRRGRQRLHAR